MRDHLRTELAAAALLMAVQRQRFGTVMENVVFDPITRVPNFDSDATTENTGVAYPIDFITDASRTGCVRQSCDTRHSTPRR